MAIFEVNRGQPVSPWFSVTNDPYLEHSHRTSQNSPYSPYPIQSLPRTSPLLGSHYLHLIQHQKLSGWHTLKKLVPETCTKQSWIILGASFWYKFLECVSPLLDSIICVSPLLVSIISAFNMSKWVPLQNKNSPPHSYRGKTNPLHQEKHEERLTLRLSRLWIDSVAMATSLETSATTSW